MKLLFIGNSFSEDTIMYLPEIAFEYGIDLTIENIGYPGCSIDQHIDFLTNRKKEYIYTRYNMAEKRWERFEGVVGSEIIQSQQWDFISLQECSYGSGQPIGYPRVNELVDAVRSLCPNKNVKFVWNMTWPYGSKNEFEFFIRDFNKDSELMYQGIVNNVKKDIVSNANFMTFIPCGTTINNLRKKQKEEDIYRDNLHLSYQIGRYAASLTFAKCFFNIDISDIKFMPLSVYYSTKQIIIDCANKTYKHPLEVTE